MVTEVTAAGDGLDGYGGGCWIVVVEVGAGVAVERGKGR